MTIPPDVLKLINAKIKRRPSVSRQISEINDNIGFWAYMFQWRVNLGQITIEEAQKKLEPLKAARNTLQRLSEKRL
jgi:hypothetical protein